MTDEQCMHTAIQMAIANVASGRGGPFAAVVVHEGTIIGQGTNRVTTANDPTAHAEIVAIREACQRLGTFQLADCILYTTCEPCPMCMGAVYWARMARVCYASTRADAAAAGFDDAHIYDELARPPEARQIPMDNVLRAAGQAAFDAWTAYPNRVEY